MKAGSATPFAQRFATLAPVIDRAFDLSAILQLSVGPAWASLPPDQQATLLTAFRRYTIANYVNSFDNYTGQHFDVLPDTKSLPNGEQLAQTKIVSSSGESHELDYVMRQEAGSLEGGGCAGRRLDQPRRGAALRLPPAGLARRRPGADREPEPEDHRPVRRAPAPVRSGHTVATGVAGEPTAPGRRSGGPVNRKRLRSLARSQSASSVR